MSLKGDNGPISNLKMFTLEKAPKGNQGVVVHQGGVSIGKFKRAACISCSLDRFYLDDQFLIHLGGVDLPHEKVPSISYS